MSKQSMTLAQIQNMLKEVLTPRRYNHSLEVMATAKKLAGLYSCNTDKAALAGLLHDCARDMRGQELIEACRKFDIQILPLYRAQPELLHGPLGAKLVRYEYGIDDPEIENAIRVHTTGCENMTLLDKIIFLADFIEPNRNFSGVDIVREIAWRSLDEAVLTSLDMIIRHVMEKHEMLLHPDTVLARNHLLLVRKGLI